jgi:hypothetical protein
MSHGKLCDPPPAKLVEFIEDPGLEALEHYVVGTLHLFVCTGVCHGGPVDPYIVVIAESEEFFPCELCVVVHDYGVWDPKAVDDVCEEFNGLLGLDLNDRPGLYPLGELVYGDSKWVWPPSAFLRGLTRSSP